MNPFYGEDHFPTDLVTNLYDTERSKVERIIRENNLSVYICNTAHDEHGGTIPYKFSVWCDKPPFNECKKAFWKTYKSD